jgi:hypothetical protein
MKAILICAAMASCLVAADDKKADSKKTKPAPKLSLSLADLDRQAHEWEKTFAKSQEEKKGNNIQTEEIKQKTKELQTKFDYDVESLKGKLVEDTAKIVSIDEQGEGKDRRVILSLTIDFPKSRHRKFEAIVADPDDARLVKLVAGQRVTINGSVSAAFHQLNDVTFEIVGENSKPKKKN